MKRSNEADPALPGACTREGGPGPTVGARPEPKREAAAPRGHLPPAAPPKAALIQQWDMTHGF
jgi:hypothetical protein